MIPKSQYRSASMALKNMSRDDTRQVIKALAIHGEMTVTALWIHVRAKHHSDVCIALRRLRDSHVVNKRREGKQIYYSINEEGIKTVRQTTRQINAGAIF